MTLQIFNVIHLFTKTIKSFTMLPKLYKGHTNIKIPLFLIIAFANLKQIEGHPFYIIIWNLLKFKLKYFAFFFTRAGIIHTTSTNGIRFTIQKKRWKAKDKTGYYCMHLMQMPTRRPSNLEKKLIKYWWEKRVFGIMHMGE